MSGVIFFIIPCLQGPIKIVSERNKNKNSRHIHLFYYYCNCEIFYLVTAIGCKEIKLKRDGNNNKIDGLVINNNSNFQGFIYKFITVPVIKEINKIEKEVGNKILCFRYFYL